MADKMLKLYDKAPAEALAALTVGAALRGASDEVKALWSAVIKDGNSPHYERYRRRRESLVLVAMLWANECLRTKADMAALSASIVSGELVNQEALAFDALHRVYQGKLAALNAAMREFAEETGLHIETLVALGAANLADFDVQMTPPRAAVDLLLKQYRELLC